MDNLDKNPLEIVIKASMDIEMLLAKHWGAKGTGLKEKFKSVQGEIPQHLHKGIQVIASMRRKSMESSFKFDDKKRERFERVYNKLREELESIAPPNPVEADVSASDKTPAGSQSNQAQNALDQAASEKNADVDKNEGKETHQDAEKTSKSASTSPKQVAETPVAQKNTWLFWLAIVGAVFIGVFIWSLQSGEEERFVSAIAPLYEDANTTEESTEDGQSRKLVIQSNAPALTAEESAKLEEKAFDQIDNELMQIFLDQLSLRLDKPEFKANKDGSFDVQILAHWNLEPSRIESLLAPHLQVKDNLYKGILNLKKYDNIDQEKIQDYSDRLYKALSDKRVKIEFSLFDVTSGITLLTGRHCVVSGCEGEGDSEVQIHYSNARDPKAILYPSHLGEQNPVVLKNLTKKQLLNEEAVIKAVVFAENKSNQVGSYELSHLDVEHLLKNSISERQQATENIEENVFKHMQDQIHFNAKAPVYKKKDNGTYDVSIDVRWSLDPKLILRVLNFYFKYPDMLPQSNLLRVKRLDNERERQKEPYTEELFNELVGYHAGLKITLGRHVEHITLASGMECFAGCKGRGDSEFQILFDNNANPSDLLLNTYQGERNPVIFKGLTKKEADQDLEIEFFWSKSNENK